MTWKDFYEKTKTGIAFSDGSMGVFLQKQGLTGEECPELWNLTKSDIIENVHRSYIEAGSDLIITNTLGGNRTKLMDYHLENKIKEINEAAVRIARKAAENKAVVAGDVGPTGLFIEPLGKTTFEEMVDIYKEQILVLSNAGADCIFFETQIDILELKAGIIACREVCDLPVIASMTFEKDGRTVTGSSPEAVFTTLEALGADIIGTNCGTGPEDMYKIIERVKGMFSVPIIVQANAGMPHYSSGKTLFDETPESYAFHAIKIAECGVGAIGGCCGTTPEHIRLLRERILETKPYLKSKKVEIDYLLLSSRYLIQKIGLNQPFKIIGERLNPTARKKLAEDIIENRFSLFKEEALNQEKSGSHILDMNMGIPDSDELILVKKGIEILSNLIKIPISIDSSNPEAIKLGLRLYPGKPILNSISAEEEKLNLMKNAKKYGSAFVALPLDEKGIPATAGERVRLMKKIIEKAEALGIDKKNILADPLVMTVSADQAGARETLKTLRLFKEELGLNTTMGLSNVSFGLPARGYINRNFLSMAIANGLTTAIANPFDEELMGLVSASDVLLGKDLQAREYIRLHSAVSKEVPVLSSRADSAEKTHDGSIEQRLYSAVINGNKDTVHDLISEALTSGMKPFDILNSHLIPAITEVGKKYEDRIYFLPQLMLSAETMQKAFSELEPLLKKNSIKPEGKIVFATVKGDVHDIGKNIVILMLKNAWI